MYDIRSKSVAGVVIIAIMLLIGFFIMNSKTKPLKTTAYYSLFVSRLITKDCASAQEAYDKLKAVDPDLQQPFKYKPIGSTQEVVLTYDKMNQYLTMCKTNTLDKKELQLLAISARKELENLDLNK